MSRKRKEKLREIDFTHTEVINELIVDERTFRNQFDKFLSKYQLDKKDFKKYNEENLSYYWLIEWTELAIVLMKAFPNNPFFRNNVGIKDITADDILNYYKTLTDETESRLPDQLKHCAYTLPSYLPTLKLVDGIPELIEKISELTAAFLILENEHPGDVISFINKTIDEWIYNLHRNTYYIKEAYSTNKKALKKEIEEALKDSESKGELTKEEKNQDRKRMKDMINQIKDIDLEDAKSLDEEMAKLLKQFMEMTKDINHLKNEDAMIWDKEVRDYLYKFIGTTDIGDKESLTEEEIKLGRLMYYDLFLDKSLELTKQEEIIVEEVENYMKRNETKKDHRQKIQEVLEKHSKMSKEELRQKRIREREEEKERLKEYISMYQERLDELENEPIPEEAYNDSEEIKVYSSYLDFYEKIKEKSKDYKDTTDLFLGQLLYSQLKKWRNIH